jgi:hypothetical protein
MRTPSQQKKSGCGGACLSSQWQNRSLKLKGPSPGHSRQKARAYLQNNQRKNDLKQYNTCKCKALSSNSSTTKNKWSEKIPVVNGYRHHFSVCAHCQDLCAIHYICICVYI